MMKKIFISCPYIKHINSAGCFDDSEYKAFTEQLYELCQKYADDVFMALKRDKYGEVPTKGYTCLYDYRELENSDLVVAFPDDSMGAAVEIGWASALGKKMIIILNENQKYSPLVKDIIKITEGETVKYQNKEIDSLNEVDKLIRMFCI